MTANIYGNCKIIFGVTSSGKSSLLNSLCYFGRENKENQYLEEFEVGKGVESCTPGPVIKHVKICVPQE